MKKSQIPVVILKTRSGYSAHSPVINGCAVTAKTIDRALKLFKEAVAFHIEGQQLFNARLKFPAKTLRASFADYGTDAFYATITVAA